MADDADRRIGRRDENRNDQGGERHTGDFRLTFADVLHSW